MVCQKLRLRYNDQIESKVLRIDSLEFLNLTNSNSNPTIVFQFPKDLALENVSYADKNDYNL